MAGFERLPSPDRLRRLRELCGTPADARLDLILLQRRVGAADQIAARHLEVGAALVPHLLFSRKASGQIGADARIAAAGENKIRVLIADKRRFAKIFGQKAWRLTHIHR